MRVLLPAAKIITAISFFILLDIFLFFLPLDSSPTELAFSYLAWLGRMDSNHDSQTQILESYHWTTSQNYFKTTFH